MDFLQVESKESSLQFPQLKEEVPYDETYAILKRVAAGEFVFLDYKNGVRTEEHE